MPLYRLGDTISPSTSTTCTSQSPQRRRYRAVTERETTIMDHEEEGTNPKIGTPSEDKKVDTVQGVKMSILQITIVG